MRYLKGLTIIIAYFVNVANAENIFDVSRNRSIPVDITFPVNL
jgi:hypothetical protein